MGREARRVPPVKVEIVPARTKGIVGYASVGRGTIFGNPYTGNDLTLVVNRYLNWFYFHGEIQAAAEALLDRDWQDGIVRIACPCNGTFKSKPCHASVIKTFLERQINLRSIGEELETHGN
jgi:hypothetical protein